MRRGLALMRLVLYWLGQLVIANAAVAWEVLTPSSGIAPAIVGVPIRARSDIELTTLASMLTITPGTLVLEIASDRQTMYVHGLHVHDPDAFRQRIGKLETLLLAVTR